MQKITMKNLFFRSLRSQQLVAVLAVALLVTVVSLALYEGSKKPVTLDVNGEQTEIKTRAHTVGHLLSEQEIDVAQQDLVIPSVNTPIEKGMTIRWEQAKKVAIIDGKETTAHWTTEQDVDAILKEAGIELGEFDIASPKVETKSPAEGQIIIERAFPVTLNDGGKEKQVWSTSTTVADFLKRENIHLNEQDRLNRKADGYVKPGSIVEVIRVEKVTDVVEEPTNFAVITKKDAKLLKGREKVVHPGKKGKVERKFEIVKENGKEVSRKMIAEKVINRPEDKVVAVGTRVAVASANVGKSPRVTVSRDNSASSGKEFYVTATAYTAKCNGCTGTTATGINLNANPNLKVVAVDPRVIPLGSKLWVEGYGYAVAGDTGGAIKGKRIDLHVPTKSEAYNYGRRKVKVKVID